jgi:hypothetical protein
MVAACIIKCPKVVHRMISKWDQEEVEMAIEVEEEVTECTVDHHQAITLHHTMMAMLINMIIEEILIETEIYITKDTMKVMVTEDHIIMKMIWVKEVAEEEVVEEEEDHLHTKEVTWDQWEEEFHNQTLEMSLKEKAELEVEWEEDNQEEEEMKVIEIWSIKNVGVHQWEHVDQEEEDKICHKELCKKETMFILEWEKEEMEEAWEVLSMNKMLQPKDYVDQEEVAWFQVEKMRTRVQLVLEAIVDPEEETEVAQMVNHSEEAQEEVTEVALAQMALHIEEETEVAWVLTAHLTEEETEEEIEAAWAQMAPSSEEVIEEEIEEVLVQMAHHIEEETEEETEAALALTAHLIEEVQEEEIEETEVVTKTMLTWLEMLNHQMFVSEREVVMNRLKMEKETTTEFVIDMSIINGWSKDWNKQILYYLTEVILSKSIWRLGFKEHYLPQEWSYKVCSHQILIRRLIAISQKLITIKSFQWWDIIS